MVGVVPRREEGEKGGKLEREREGEEKVRL